MQTNPLFQALNFNVIVEQKVLDNKLASGFDLSGYTDATEVNQAGVVVSVGERCPTNKDGEHSLKIGMTVIYSKHKVTNMTLSGKTYCIVPYSDLVLTL
jgi:co-chaperonin GroES (HSP10)